MKLKSLALVATLSISSWLLPATASSAAPTCAEGGECIVGDIGPGGGRVFFVKSTNTLMKSRTVGSGMYSQTFTLTVTANEQAALPFDYLEVAPTQSSTLRWGSNGSISGGTATEIGTGAANTTNIVNSFPSDNSTNNAAIYADNYYNNSKSDWFLPSYDELLLINLVSLESDSGGPNIGSFPDGLWASTSTDNSNARYSARTQLSGYVVKASSAKARAIRSFSKTVTTSGNNDDDSTRREAERKRQEAISRAQSEILRKVLAHIRVLREDLAAAESALLGEPSLLKANEDFLTLDTSTAIDLQRVYFVISKYEIYDQILRDTPGVIYPRNLVKFGLLQEETPMKSLTTRNLIELPLEQRDTHSEVDAFIASESKKFQDRKTHLAATILRIQSR
jgi:hypothetical protein